jgi:RNase adaptor protein for sRNA GlmZ degradation
MEALTLSKKIEAEQRTALVARLQAQKSEYEHLLRRIFKERREHPLTTDAGVIVANYTQKLRVPKKRLRGLTSK